MEEETSTESIDFQEENESGEEEEEDDEEEGSIGGEDEEGVAESEEFLEKQEELDPVQLKIERRRKCKRRRKYRRIYIDNEVGFAEEEDEGDEEEGEEEADHLLNEEEQEENEGHIEYEYELVLDDLSHGSSILSGITFEWENELYQFEELCDSLNIDSIYQKRNYETPFLDDFGIYRYRKLCTELFATPMSKILSSLQLKEIDLSYRNVGSNSIRAMCGALEVNGVVEKLIMRFNKLTEDDCSYIGLVFKYNDVISVLDFTGCRIGPVGLNLLISNLSQNSNLSDLNLSKCDIGDEGMKVLAYVLMRNNSIVKIDLSHNKLGDESAESLAMVFKVNTCLENLNLSYNYLFNSTATKGFFRSLSGSQSLTHLNLSWNGLNGTEIGNQIGGFLRKNGSIECLDLSDNRLEGFAILGIKKGLAKSSSLKILKLGKNPATADDLEGLLLAGKNCVPLKVLDFEDNWVNKSFMKALKKIQQEKDLEVILGGVYGNYQILGPDYPAVIFKRAQFEAMKPKKAKKRKDFGHLMWTLGDEPLTEEAFMKKVKKFKAKINKELFPELIKQFITPKTRLIDVVAMRNKYLSVFPDSIPPPPPKVKAKKGKKDKEGKNAVEEYNYDEDFEEKGLDEISFGEFDEFFEENLEEDKDEKEVEDENEEDEEENLLLNESSQIEEEDEEKNIHSNIHSRSFSKPKPSKEVKNKKKEGFPEKGQLEAKGENNEENEIELYKREEVSVVA